MDSGFEIFVKRLLKTFIADNIVETLIANHHEKIQASFTSKNFDPVYNYEFFEIIGDLTINKFIVAYMCKRFPQLRSSNGVTILAILKIFYGSKDLLSSLAEKLSFDKYVRTAAKDVVDKNKYISVLEDVFEAFCGVIEYSLDLEYGIGVGYAIVYKFLEQVFDAIDISIDYDKLVDNKTKLNELKNEHKLALTYVTKHENQNFLTNVLLGPRKLVIGTGVSEIKKNSETIASSGAIQWLKTNMNIVKETPEKFKLPQTKLW